MDLETTISLLVIPAIILLGSVMDYFGKEKPKVNSNFASWKKRHKVS